MMQQTDLYLNERIVITSKNEVTYAGISKNLLTIEGKPGLQVEIDQKSGFSIWCPIEFIKEIILIPIPKDTIE